MLKDDQRKDIVSYRYAKALETLDEARLVADAGRWGLCANRLYYAAYYAISAVLFKEGHNPKTHKGAISLFGRMHIHSGHLERKQLALISKLESMRTTGDYGDCFDFDEDMVVPYIPETEEFVRLMGVIWNIGKID